MSVAAPYAEVAAGTDPSFGAMLDEVAGAAALYRPSRFWENLNRINFEMLTDHGLENFKRTVAQNYFNWLVIRKGDNQFRNARRAWMRHPSLQPFFNVLDKPELLKTTIGLERAVGGKELFVYKLFVGMLWEMALRGDRSGLAASLEEPEVGNPIAIRRRSRRISQDLANSIREFNTLLEAEPTLRGRSKRLAELGAGYGRLAYVLLSDPGTRYFIFDIPPALYVSQWYLTQLFPGEKVFRFRHIDNFSDLGAEIASSRIAFFTPNQVELFPDRFFDVFSSISTLPEMTEMQSRNYIVHMQRTSAGLVYLKQWTNWDNSDDGRLFAKSDVALNPPFRCVLDRADAVQDLFFEQVWRREDA